MLLFSLKSKSSHKCNKTSNSYSIDNILKYNSEGGAKGDGDGDGDARMGGRGGGGGRMGDEGGKNLSVDGEGGGKKEEKGEEEEEEDEEKVDKDGVLRHNGGHSEGKSAQYDERPALEKTKHLSASESKLTH